MNITPAIADFHRRLPLDEQQTLADRPVGFQARLALDRATRSDAYRLRHLCYTASGHIDPRPDGEFSDHYDYEPNNKTIVIYKDEQAVASVRVCAMDRAKPECADLPLAAVFPEEFQAMMPADGRAVELNRLVRHPDHAHSQGLVFVLFRMADFIIRQHDPDFVASCVRTNHTGFYKRLRFEHVAGPKLYTGLKFTTNFLACQRESYAMVRRTVPVLRISDAAAASYEPMLDGQTVPVFGNA